LKRVGSTFKISYDSVIREILQEAWLARYRFESVESKVKMFRDKSTVQDISEESLCFTRA
jgi:hypothetical protein